MSRTKCAIDLLPCPWCGSENVNEQYSEDLDGHAVVCQDCNACGPGFDQNGPDGCDGLEAKAIAAWNKGPYIDRAEVHAAALKAHADKLIKKAEEHQRKAAELLAKAGKALGGDQR